MHFRKGKTAERYPEGREFDRAHADGTMYCRKCHAVHQNKRWHFDESLYAKLSADKSVEDVTCPGCNAIKLRKIDGILTLRSPFVSEHKDEMLRMLHHEEATECEKNPLSRIAHIEHHEGEIQVQTTTRFLCTRLGRAVERAYQGKLEISHPPYEAFVWVNWSREEQPG